MTNIDLANALVVGLGNIGLNYDYSSSRNILTHSKAYYHHPNYNLIGGVDFDEEARKKFQKKYKKNTYETIEKAVEQENPHVVSVCVPYKEQLFCIEKILSYFQPTLIICEKPLTDKYEKSKKLLEMVEQNKSTICVNYMRRFEPGVNRIKAIMDAGEIGTIQKVNCWYAKSFWINASHLIDLSHYFWGSVNNIFVKKKYINSVNESLLVDFEMLMENGSEVIVSSLPIDVSLFELDIIGSKGRIKYMDGGQKIVMLQCSKNKLFPQVSGFFKSTIIKNQLFRYQYHVLDAVFKNLQFQEPLSSNGHTALMTEKTMYTIIEG